MCLGLIGSLLFTVDLAQADGPVDNRPESVRQIPPPGIDVRSEDRTRLQAQLDDLHEQMATLERRDDEFVQSLLPDVEIFARAVDQALRFNEMFSEADIKRAGVLLEEGSRRADLLADGKSPWTQQKGLVVRGFRSRLDDTVQPYGLLIPESYTTETPGRYRCDVWLHGRGERSVELQFIHTRMTNRGAIEPEDTIVLHPFGRYSNAFKFAGEVDVLEALEHAKSQYRIDDERIGMRGFSMGGAGCWHLALHYPDRWYAANPGAGFSETPQFLLSFQGESLSPTWWEKTLWQWYDCPEWRSRMYHCPIVAYSGELDRQKQAADLMWKLSAPDLGLNVSMSHVVGPNTGHKIHPDSLVEIEQRMSGYAKRRGKWNPSGSNDNVSLSTRTLRYNRMHWLTINGLARHWMYKTKSGYAPANGNAGAHIVRDGPTPGIDVSSLWVSDLTLHFDAGKFPFDDVFPGMVRIGRSISREAPPIVPDGDLPPLNPDGSWTCRFYNESGAPGYDAHAWKGWRIGTPPWEDELRKRHGLQGPIDDAFMDSFLFVTPSGECRHAEVEEWTRSEFEHAVTHWRQQMRGDARVKADSDVTDEDIAQHNLILWGDPASNSVMARIMQDLPIQWTDSEVIVGERRFDAAHYAPILIFPNPLNPKKYVVLNSSFTYREYDYLNNARQTPKLPDWAVVDLRVPPDSRWPGKIVDADFFNEKWELQLPYYERVSEER